MSGDNPYESPEPGSDARAGGSSRKRPLGVWIITIWLALFAGIFPAGLAIFVLVQPQVQQSLGATTVELGIDILFRAVIVLAAILAWRGSNPGRYLLLVLGVIHYALFGFDNAAFFLSAEIPDEVVPRLVGRVIRSLFWIAVLIWYLGISQRPRGFYQRQEPVT